MKQAIYTEKAPEPAGPYSQAIRVGNLVYTAGQGPIDPVTGDVIGRSIEEQTLATIDNLAVILNAMGTSLDHAIKATVHLADLSDFDAFNAAYETRFVEPRPVRTTVGSELMSIMVEIDLIAEMPDS